MLNEASLQCGSTRFVLFAPGRCLFIVFLLLAAASASYAAPLFLQLTIDKLLVGRAVLSGSIAETPFLTDPNICVYFPKCTQGTAIGTNWFFQATLYSQPATHHETFYTLKIETHHLKAPHDGESAPNILTLVTFNFDLSRAGGDQDAADSVIHPGSIDHFDVLRTHIDDLNGSNPGFLSFGRDELSARIDTEHTPEPSTLLLLGTGLAGLAAGVRRRAV